MVKRMSYEIAELEDINYDEAKVVPYELPDPLVCEDGTKITSSELWVSKRRAELLKFFSDQMYGYSPDEPTPVLAEVVEEETAALGGLATRRQVKLWFREDKSGPCVNLLLHFSNQRQQRGPEGFPAFLGYNFRGNHATSLDPAIFINPLRSDQERGRNRRCWPFERIVERGYASVTACYFDIDPDENDLTEA